MTPESRPQPQALGARWIITTAAAPFASGGLPKAFALQLLRFGVLAAVLYGVAQFGALALLCAALGILIARSIILRRMRSL